MVEDAAAPDACELSHANELTHLQLTTPTCFGFITIV
jgi:hypothetical protein